MCTTDNIRLLIKPITFIKLLFALYVCIVGIQYASTDFIHKAYGIYFLSAGVGIFFMGFFSGALCLPQMFAVKRHNKFVLLVCFLADGLLMSQAITVGLRCYNYSVKVFSPELQNDCLQNAPEIYSHDECLYYMRHDSTVGMRLAWASFYSLSGDPTYYQYLSVIQEENLCCGFGPPLRCLNDTRKPPPDRPLDNLDSIFTKRRVTCGETSRYYPQQDNCLHYFDPNTIPQIIGGCEYDMALGNCVDNDAAAFNSFGCANFLEDYVATFVGPPALLIIGSSGMNILSMLISCCLIWKRKDSDVFPDFIHEKTIDDWGKQKKIIVYEKIRDNVMVVPQPDILYARGFLPRPGEERESLEDADEGEVELPVLENGPATDDEPVSEKTVGPHSRKDESGKQLAMVIEDAQSNKGDKVVSKKDPGLAQKSGTEKSNKSQVV